MTKIFFVTKIFCDKFFLTKKLWQKNLVTKIFLWTNFFVTKICLWLSNTNSDSDSYSDVSNSDCSNSDCSNSDWSNSDVIVTVVIVTVVIVTVIIFTFLVLLERAIWHIWQPMWCSQGSVLRFLQCFWQWGQIRGSNYSDIDNFFSTKKFML